MQTVLEQFNSLSEHLIRLCHWQPPAHRNKVASTASAHRDFEHLVRLLPCEVNSAKCTNANPCDVCNGGRLAITQVLLATFTPQVMVPNQEQFRAPLPPAAGGSRSGAEHPAGGGGGGGASSGLIKISALKDELQIMQSLMVGTTLGRECL